MKNKWTIIYECDDEDDNPTCWALEINHEKYGKYVWICLSEGENVREYSVEVDYLNEMRSLVKCKSLASAKRWVTINLL